MFEDSLVESCGRIRTRSHRYVAGSLFLQAAIVTTLVVIPYLYPAALPERFLSVPLIAPPPAAAPAMVAQPISRAPIAHPELLMSTIIAPPGIPTTIGHAEGDLPPSLVIGGNAGVGPGNGTAGPILPGFAVAAAPRVESKPAQKPAHVRQEWQPDSWWRRFVPYIR